MMLTLCGVKLMQAIHFTFFFSNTFYVFFFFFFYIFLLLFSPLHLGKSIVYYLIKLNWERSQAPLDHSDNIWL